jgi:very-short-patch-repair endonuclease
MSRFGYEMIGGIRIWLLTPEAVSEMLPLRIGLFDLAIFDEASQMRMERGIPSLYRAKKAAVAGDPKQLRPSSVGTGRYKAEEDGEGSLLDAARPRFPSFLLGFHYRSKYAELIEFSNRAFYGGKLMVAPNVREPESPAIEVRVTDGIWEDRRNEKEARVAVEALREFLAERRNGETVGIITFNSFQRDLVADILDDACASDLEFGRAVAKEMRRTECGEDVGLFVKNVESVQGDERDVIIFSCGYGRNREGRFLQRFGWLSAKGGENRLNVAITRAKEKLILIRSFDPGDIRSDGTLGGPEIFKRYVRYADAVSSGNREEAERILDSFACADESKSEAIEPALDILESRLKAAGLDVERNVGIGSHRIGLAIREDGNRILGVELDRTLYASDPDPRSRDCLRRRYLNSRGWNVMRVWTPLIWRDPDGIADAIIDASGFSKEPMKS